MTVADLILALASLPNDSVVVRVRAPLDEALDERLFDGNVTGVSVDEETGEAGINIDT